MDSFNRNVSEQSTVKCPRCEIIQNKGKCNHNPKSYKENSSVPSFSPIKFMSISRENTGIPVQQTQHLDCCVKSIREDQKNNIASLNAAKIASKKADETLVAIVEVMQVILYSSATITTTPGVIPKISNAVVVATANVTAARTVLYLAMQASLDLANPEVAAATAELTAATAELTGAASKLTGASAKLAGATPQHDKLDF